MIGHPVGIYSSWWVQIARCGQKYPGGVIYQHTTRAQPLVVQHAHTLCSCLQCTMKQSIHCCRRAFDLRPLATTYTHQRPSGAILAQNHHEG